MRVLLVEDDDNRRRWFRQMMIGVPIDVTLDVEEAKRFIDANEYDQIFLDHDLSEEHYAVWREGSDKHDATTGYAVADYLAANPEKSKDAEIIVHSLNPHGSDRMWRRMRETRRNVRKVPFNQLVEVAR